MNFKEPAKGRKSAYYLRNRLALIAAAQRVLAETGPDTNLEDVANAAGMAVSTIYKHFPNREELIETAIVEAMFEWEVTVFEQTNELLDPIEQLVVPMRLLLKSKSTHPVFSQMAVKNRDLVSKMFPRITTNLLAHVKRLIDSGVLKITDPELRTRNMSACLFAAFEDEVTNPNADESENLKAIQIALLMLGIDEEKSSQILNG